MRLAALSAVVLSLVCVLSAVGDAQAQATPEAQFAAAMQHHSGDGVLQDYARAATYLAAAAEAGHAPAQNLLGRYYFEGLGVTRDRAEALRWLELAAQAGAPDHVLDLGQVLETDPATLPRAVELYTQAAAAGMADAAVSLGVLYQEGRGVRQDFEQARNLYEGAAAQGHARALNNLGLLYVRANGVPRDYARAAALFGQAADQGLKQAMTNLGVLYENGFGVPLDEERAAALYRAAAQDQTPEPDYVYDVRLKPLEAEDEALALQARSGDPVAQFQWAWARLTDDASSFEDRRMAAQMLQQTAAQGHAPSMFNLGLLHMRGVGVPQDFVLGHSWLLLAQANGISQAGAALTRGRARMTAAQVNDAQRRAQQFLQ